VSSAVKKTRDLIFCLRRLPMFQRYLLPPSSLIVLMMEAASTSEMVVNFYETTQRYNPEDSHLHTFHRENLKSHLFLRLFKNPVSTADVMQC
jgi:hypothetical protein